MTLLGGSQAGTPPETVPVDTQVETTAVAPAGDEITQVHTETKLDGALKAVMDSIEATGETIVAPWQDPVREQQLRALRNWNNHRELDVELPEEELPWLWEGGFIKVAEESVSLVDKDEFEKKLTLKFGPVIKALGGDDMGFGAALHRALNPKPKATTRKKD